MAASSGDPPNLAEWRNKLFAVEQPMVLSEEEWNIYWPYIDNVWSHRSTQKSKKGPFVTHYYDCRLKGRPPGTPQNNDPNKRKRKRTARERDLCEMKIKVVETFPTQARPFKSYSIEKVKRDPTQAGGESVGETHRHPLEESDRIKRNSVMRNALKMEKELKKVQKTYHKRATGQALQTVKRHSKLNELKLFGACFCPFVQRVWIALEVKGINYQYIEVDPYKKPTALMEVNPRGHVPALRHGDWVCHESSVLLEYLEDLGVGQNLLSPHPQIRANIRLWADHVDRNIIPGFYRTLQEQDPNKQIQYANDLKREIHKLVEAADPMGPFFMGGVLCLVDVMFAPWMLRLSRVLHPYRGWPLAEPGSRWGNWVNAIEAHDAVKNTTSDETLYLDSYERFAGGSFGWKEGMHSEVDAEILDGRAITVPTTLQTNLGSALPAMSPGLGSTLGSTLGNTLGSTLGNALGTSVDATRTLT